MRPDAVHLGKRPHPLPLVPDSCTPPRTPRGTALAVIGDLPADDLASLLNVVDCLVAKSRLRAMAGDLG